LTPSGRRASAALVLGLSLVLARGLVFDLRTVASDTMEPGLARGDLLLLSRLSAPAVGDVVLVRLSADADRYLGRVVALPGERVEVVDGELRVEGRSLQTGGARRVPVSWHCVDREVEVVEEARAPRHWEVVSDHGSSDPEIVPDGAFWVLADHRPAGRDSRSWGPIEAPLITGVVVARLWRRAACP